jgi:DNA-binding Xre family transcriptional regulator
MIRTKREYEVSLEKLKQNDEALKKQKEELVKLNLSEVDIGNAMAPLMSFRNQLYQEIQLYENIKAKNWKCILQLYTQHIGRFLIALRLAFNLNQRELASILGVTEAQISKDERNEYHGVSLEKVNKILEIFDVKPMPPKINKNIDKTSLLQAHNH